MAESLLDAFANLYLNFQPKNYKPMEIKIDPKNFVSTFNLKGLNIKNYKIEIVAVSKIEEAFSKLFG